MSATTIVGFRGPLHQGQSAQIISETVSGSGTLTKRFSIDSDSVLISLAVTATSGTIDVAVYTSASDTGPLAQELLVISFPTILAPTSALIIKKAAAIMGYIRVVVTHSGAATLEVKARGMATGESSVRILGQNAATAYATTIGIAPTLLIPASISDRVGIAIHNTSTLDIVYMGFTSAECLSIDAWEISPGEKLGLDIASGVDVYTRAAAGSIKVKLLEAGS